MHFRKAAGHTIRRQRHYGQLCGCKWKRESAVTWRFEDEALWLEPVVYESAEIENIVALHYFAQGTGQDASPTLENFYLILPGISESPADKPDCHCETWG